jgi:RNA recognition motif-containing protein
MDEPIRVLVVDDDEAHAEAALNAINNYELKGKKLEVSKHNKKDKKKPENAVAPVAAKKNNLFVKRHIDLITLVDE